MPDAVTHYFRYTTDDVSDTSPSWVDASDLVRGFDINRGRANELSRVDPGTARILLDNRGRDFDPVANPLIRPMNRWWLQVVHPGGTDDLFFGYAESYQQEWPGAGGRDAVCLVHLVDEFKVLALDALPTMSPPRDHYKEVVLFDNPQGYWRGYLMSNRISHAPEVGNVEMGVYSGAWGRVTSPIIGDYGDIPQTASVPTLLAVSLTGESSTTDPDTLLPGYPEAAGPGDAGGLSTFTFETWFKSSEATPAATRIIAEGPYGTGPSTTWDMQLTTTGKIAARIGTGAGTVTATGATSISANVWYHIAVVYNGATIKVYLNGVEDASAAQTGTVIVSDTGGAHYYMSLGRGTPGGTRYYDEWAFYRDDLAADRILAHYTAGALRGFGVQDPGARITAVLTAADNTAPTSIRAGSREMTPVFMKGQSPLEEIRRAELAENVDAVLFIAKDGTITFLDDGHRSVSPWDTVQATFDDDGTDLPYLNVTVDYSESFLYNVVEVARQGGTLVTDQDADSITENFRRPLPIGELPITTDADVTSAAASLVAKYKDAMIRITGLSLTTGHDGIAAAVFPLEIGDRIRVQRTPPQGDEILYPSTSLYPSTTLYPTSGRIDQTLFIQKIQVTGNAQSPYWNITLGVSPL